MVRRKRRPARVGLVSPEVIGWGWPGRRCQEQRCQGRGRVEGSSDELEQIRWRDEIEQGVQGGVDLDRGMGLHDCFEDEGYGRAEKSADRIYTMRTSLLPTQVLTSRS